MRAKAGRRGAMVVALLAMLALHVARAGASSVGQSQRNLRGYGWVPSPDTQCAGPAFPTLLLTPLRTLTAPVLLHHSKYNQCRPVAPVCNDLCRLLLLHFVLSFVSGLTNTAPPEPNPLLAGAG